MGALAGCFNPDPETTNTGDPGGSTGPGGTTSSPDVVGCGASEKPELDAQIKVTSGGAERDVVVHLPPEYDPSKPVPLVLAYHFVNGTPGTMDTATGLSKAADTAGMAIVYPVGTNGSFNAGKCCGKAWEEGIDDVTFTRDILSALEATYCIDKSRIYATGMSGGGMMAYRLACEMAGELAAVAPVAGALHMMEPCTPSRPIPILAIHGTADESVPFAGGEGQPPIPWTGDMMFASVEENVAAFRTANECADATTETYNKGDSACVAWTGCKADATVELCTIDGGGHTWPSGSFPSILGKTSTDLDASAHIMMFFSEHSLK